VAIRRLSPDTWALIAVAGVVVLANLPYLLGVFDPNPLGTHAALLSSLTRGPVAGASSIDPNGGYISQALSHRAALDVLHLRLPWWNPYEATGVPLAGELQSAALFPPTLLTALSNGQLYEHILLELMAGIATLLLLRRIGLGRCASVAGAIAFALNGTFAWFSHAAVNPLPFLPLLLLGVELAYAAALEGRGGGWWLIAIAGALSFYAGFPEGAYIDALLAVCWFGWRCGCIGRSRAGTFALKGAAGVLVGTLLSAPLLVAAVGYLGHANLGLNQSGVLGASHLPADQLPQLLLPYVYGPIDGFGGHGGVLFSLWDNVGGYLTTSLVTLALVGLLASSRRGLRFTLVGWIVLAGSRIYGVPVLGAVLGVLPGMAHVAFYRYGSASVELAVIVLAAHGLEDLAMARLPRRHILAAAASLVLVASAAIGSRPLIAQLEPRFHQRPYFAVAVAWGALIVIAVCGVALVRAMRVRIGLMTALIALDAIALFVAPEFSAPRAVSVDRAPVTFLERNLHNGRFFTLGPLQPNYGAYYALASLNVDDVPVPSSFVTYVHRRLDQVVNPWVFNGAYGGGRPADAPTPRAELLRNLAGYRAAGVAYVLAPAGMTLPLKLVFRSQTTRIYRLTGAQPYFSASGCRVAAASRSQATLSCARPAVLVRRETQLPGWSASTDGRAVAIGRFDGLFQEVAVPAGSHRVRFSYSPPGTGWGWLAFVLGLAWLAWPGLLRRRVSRRS
jgi:hypothetical protein